MSKASRKHRKQRSFPWPILIFAGVLLIAAALFFANRPGSAAQATTGSSSGTARIAVDPEKIDYGYVKFGNNETFRIKVTNTGDGVLRFTGNPYIEVVEGC